MDFQFISFIITLITGVASLILAIFAIWLGKASERESRANFERTQEEMRLYNERTKDVLAEIDKRAAVIEKTVTDSQQQLLDTVTNLLSETVVPAKPDIGEQMGLAFFQSLMEDPEQAAKKLEALQSFTDIGNQQQIQRPEQLPKSRRKSGRLR